MSEQGGIGTTIAPETTPRVEQLMMGEAHCGLPKNQPHSPDVVAAFGKSSQPDSLKLNYITESSSAPPYTHDQIKEVEKNVQKLIDEGKCSGVYLNCLGKNGQSVESAKATIVFLEKLVELVENKGDIAEAISEAKKTINFANIEGFSAVVVGNDGTVQVISEGESAVRVVRGGKVELIGDKLQKDDQLVLCAKSEVEGQDGGRLGEIIKGTKDTKEVIDALIEPPASEKDKLTPVISSLPSREPLDPKKYSLGPRCISVRKGGTTSEQEQNYQTSRKRKDRNVITEDHNNITRIALAD